MRRVVLVSCGKRKRLVRSPAGSLYVGSLFTKSLAYARRLAPSAIYILSAKHGLLRLDEEIEPYEMTLNRMSKAARAEWDTRVLRQLAEVADLSGDHFIFLTGERYREGLVPGLVSSEAPLAGLPLGRQLQFLSRNP